MAADTHRPDDGADIVLSVRDLETRFGDFTVHDGIDLDVRRGEVMGVVGGSGSGKSVLLREIIGLQRPTAGRIELLGQDVWSLTRAGRTTLVTRAGVLFQDGALFSSLTVAENVQVGMREHLDLSPAMMDELAALKIALVGLPPEAGAKLPAELSGGMRKRAGLARALALDPEIVFLDEPTAGLDPIGAARFDELIGSLQESLGLTVFMVTHDLDSLAAVCDRIAALVDKRIRVATMADHMKDDHPWLHEYFHGPRARAVGGAADAAAPQP